MGFSGWGWNYRTPSNAFRPLKIHAAVELLHKRRDSAKISIATLVHLTTFFKVSAG